MKYITHNDYDINTNGASYQGVVRASYSQLTVLFGQPHAGDGYKVDAEWEIEWEDGLVTTIYNWKDGVNYLGWGEGTPTELISEWHIGGRDPGCHVERIEDLIKNFDRVTTIQGHNYEFTHKSD